MGKQVITAAYINKEHEAGHTTLKLCTQKCIITPGAWDKIEEYGMSLGDSSQGSATEGSSACSMLSQGSSQDATTPAQGITDQVFNLLRDQLPDENAASLEAVVRKVVESKLLGAPQTAASIPQSSKVTVQGNVALINGAKVFENDSKIDVPGTVSISDAIRCHSEAPCTATYMQWKKASFDRTIEASEIHLVVEGELELTVDGRVLSAKAGDMLYMNKGAVVTYSTPSSVKITCVNIQG